MSSFVKLRSKGGQDGKGHYHFAHTLQFYFLLIQIYHKFS